MSENQGARIVAEVLTGEESIPDRVSLSWVSRVFGVTERNVLHAVQVGKLPSTREGARVYVRPSDAALIWGHRLRRNDT